MRRRRPTGNERPPRNGFLRVILPLLALSCTCHPAAAAQDPELLDGPRPELSIPRLDSAPSLEDFLEMRPSPAFRGKMVEVRGGFIQVHPSDGAPASHHTDVYLGYDRHNLYVVFVAFDDEPEKIRAGMGRRETTRGDDIVEIQLDTFRDRRRAYTFLCNPHGVQWDAIWREGKQFDMSFDTVWHSRGRITDRGYVVWMAIPFKSLRFPATEEQTWGFFLVRDVPRVNESGFYPRMSKRIEGRLNQEGTLTGIRGISPGRNALLIPYASLLSYRDLEDAGDEQARRTSEHGDVDGGIDAKFVFRDSLVLDLTANPDFSQVESDEPQITANRRFEVFFPEKRPFFLENNAYFETPLQLLFTRRIADPRAGIRLTGKTGAFNLGALVIDDEAAGIGREPGDPLQGKSARFDVVRLSRDLFEQSMVGLLYTGRTLGDSYNRVAGIDGRFKLNTHWVSDFQAVASRTRYEDGSRSSGPAYRLRLTRKGYKFTNQTTYEDIGGGFHTEAGFVPRTDIRDMRQVAEYRFRPEGRRLLAWGPDLHLKWIQDHDGLLLSRHVRPEFELEFPGRTEVRLFHKDGKERLRPVDFDVLTDNAAFDVHETGILVESAPAKTFRAELSLIGGKWINFAPPESVEPFPADSGRLRLDVDVRANRRLRLQGSLLLTHLDDRASGARIFSNSIARIKGSWQFDRRTSLRAIVEYDSLRTDPSLTSLETEKRLDADLLFTYQVNPWTAFYVGYRSGYENLALIEGQQDLYSRVRTPDADLNTDRQLFVKLSWLFRL